MAQWTRFATGRPSPESGFDPPLDRSSTGRRCTFALPASSEAAFKRAVKEASDCSVLLDVHSNAAEDARAAIAPFAELVNLEEGRPLPSPSPDAGNPEADYIELIPLSVTVGVSRLTRTR